jgi:hypothetical protein
LFHAHQSGIPTFKSLKQAQKAHWRPERRFRLRRRFEKPEPAGPLPDLRSLRPVASASSPKFLSYPAIRVLLFTLGVLALLSIAAMLLPAAVVFIQPEVQTQTVVIDLRAGPQFQTVNLSGAIPARPLNVVVEGRNQLETSGLTHTPDEFATGRVVITNLSDQSIHIPTGTTVRTTDVDPVRFTTTRSGTLPAGTGEAITITVQAVLPGEAGNLSANRLVALEGTLGANLSVTNPAPTSGGTDRLLPSATQYNRDRLFDLLEDALRQTAAEELQNLILEGDVLFTSTISRTNILEADYTPPEDIPSDELSLNLRLEYTALSASGSDLQEIASQILNASLPQGYVPLPDSLMIRDISEPVHRSGVMRWRVQASRQIQADLPSSAIIDLVLGQPPLIAGNRLSTELPLTQPPMIIMQPAWWPRLPFLPFRISVRIAG